MSRKPSNRPTDAELAILRVLWRRGPSTVRQVQEELPSTGYTTILKLLQIMTDKCLVERDESQRAHIYRTHDSEQATQRHMVGDLLDRAFGGSAANLVLQALAARPASSQEMTEIRKALDDMAQDDIAQEDVTQAEDQTAGDEG